LKYLIIFILITYQVFAQDDNAQDADRDQYNQSNTSVSSQRDDVPYFNNGHQSSGKSQVKYKLAKVTNILGKWNILGTENSMIEFKHDDTEKSFYFYDGELDSGSSGTWEESYDNDILTLTLTHLEAGITEKLSVQRINRRKLALGSIQNGEFVCRSHIKKQK